MPARQRRANPQAYPPDLETAEAAIVSRRREEAGPGDAGAHEPTASRHHELPLDAVGFGLSGGGIRSATFNLGVFQALAASRLVRRIDFVSTVSGGGYFGSFLGRLFTQPWIRGIDDVERVLRGIEPESEPAEREGWGRRVFRWLRDNGRYLAPRGSGDLLVFGSVLLRNWIAVQVVLVTTLLTLFVALQIGRIGLERALGLTAAGSGGRVAWLLSCGLPGGASTLWWSPWLVVALLPLGLVAVPTGWAFWLVVRRRDGRLGLPPFVGAFTAMAIGLAGTIYYGARPGHPARLAVSALLFGSTLLTLLFWRVGELRVRDRGTPSDTANLLRSRLSRLTKTALVATAVLAAWALLDTFGGTVYAASRIAGRSLSHWAVGLFTGFAGIGAFARPLALLLAPSTPGTARPRIPASILSWIAAVLFAAVWLTAIDIGSHAVAWEFKVPVGAPTRLGTLTPPPVLGADHLVVGRDAAGFVVRGEDADQPACEVPTVARYGVGFPIAAFVVLLVMTTLFGHTLTFANMSSIHSFYAARLTRTYLGASNPERLRRQDLGVTETVSGDDCTGAAYWNWPQVSGKPSTDAAPVQPYMRGGPLHIVNTTINETYDVRTKVQNQDRKGTGLAIGPCGLSVGIRHHLISTAEGVRTAPQTGHCVFRLGDGAATPDPLTLGRWMSVSGAAFSAAAGANTTVPMAILAGLFNVRLGYWWDSGTAGASAGPLEWALPVQAALFNEMLAHTRGTAGRLWNLSDGGHFENMGGYELVRRRLPIIVIVDAEADPDYTFEGLSDLVRKARLDFDAEIVFLTERQLSGEDAIAGTTRMKLPAELRKYFGDLDALRRGKWSNEELPYPPAPDNRSFTIEADRSRVSRAHAALARVAYDNGDTSWLVYVKATLMGDEPEDVCHYHRAHPEFPQETTADQFFDERQWESYRRLGLHVGHRVLTPQLFALLDAYPPPSDADADALT